MNCQHCGMEINAGEITYAWGQLIICHNCYMALSTPPAAQQMVANLSYAGHSLPHAPPNSKYVQTIEKTAKFWKLQMVIASVFCVLGLLLYAEAWPDKTALESLALVIMIGCAIWLIVIKFMVWWHHG